MTAFPPIREACMGGWCNERRHCAKHLQEDRRHVSERLCIRGQEQPVPVVLVKPPQPRWPVLALSEAANV